MGRPVHPYIHKIGCLLDIYPSFRKLFLWVIGQRHELMSNLVYSGRAAKSGGKRLCRSRCALDHRCSVFEGHAFQERFDPVAIAKCIYVPASVRVLP